MFQTIKLHYLDVWYLIVTTLVVLVTANLVNSHTVLRMSEILKYNSKSGIKIS